MIVKLLGRRLGCPCKGLALGPAPGHGLGPAPGPCKAVGPGPSRALYRRYSDSPPASIRDIDLAAFPPERVRNFCIVAHVDHGKSTLADRVLELAGAIDTKQANRQVLDSLQVERERGITVKAQSASVLWRHQGEDYLLNLIDTPGHVDFSYEVTRSLRACQGVLLLVDANQGVQAQTVSNFFLAFAANLTILPVINKIDLPGADPELVTEQLLTIFEVDPGRVLPISAKLGLGVAALLDRVVEEVPPPTTLGREADLRILLFDSWFDRWQGAVTLVQVAEGVLRVGQTIASSKTGREYKVGEVGLLTPSQHPCPALYPGQVGYLMCNMRKAREAVLGDTLHLAGRPVTPLLDIQPAKPMVYAGVYPFNASEHRDLALALEKLCLSDPSVALKAETSAALGQGWRLGFLGVLHMEVFTQRLDQEQQVQVVITAPSVPYTMVLGARAGREQEGREVLASSPAEFLERPQVVEYREPMVAATILTPATHLAAVLHLCHERRGVQRSVEHIDQSRLNLQFLLPLNEIVTSFFDALKSATSGYASFDYEDAGFEAADLVRLDVLLNGTMVAELATVGHASKARERAKAVVANLREELPRQQFNIAIQAAVRGKVLARTDIKPSRKDVTAKCYGGDMSRKMKLLKNQAEGKKRMKMVGNIEIAKETFIKILTKQ